MVADHLREVHNARPSVHYRLHLSDSRKLDVRHPEFLALSPGGRTAYVIADEHSLERVDMLLIVSIETQEPKSGAKRRRTG